MRTNSIFEDNFKNTSKKNYNLNYFKERCMFEAKRTALNF